MARKSMSRQEFDELLTEIMDKHAWGCGVGCHMIKYVRPHFDCRTNEFYGLTLQGMLGKKDFFIVNEDRDRDLTAWVKEFLATPPDEAGWEPHGFRDDK